MLLSNILVFSIYQDCATIGVLHGLAVVSFASFLSAVVLARSRKGGPGARIAYGHVMLWSFGGMVAAGLGQGATLLGQPPWPAILAALLVVGLLAARLDVMAMLPGHWRCGTRVCRWAAAEQTDQTETI